MKKVLITGANKGLGLEMARQLLKKGYCVFIGSRDLKNGWDAVHTLKAEGLENMDVVQLDVTDQQSVNAARIAIGTKTHVLDMLINNAGINGIEFNGNTPIMHSALETGIDKFKEVYEVNDPVLSM